MIVYKTPLLLPAAVVAGVFIAYSTQAQTILEPQTPLKTFKPVVTKTAPKRQDYRIPGREFYLEARNYGFNTNAHAKSFGSKCEVDDFINENALALEVGRFQGLPGSKCDFDVFKGQTLKNGFVFKSYRGEKKVKGQANIDLTSRPASGGASIKFTLHGWDDPGDNEAYYMFNEFILEGPGDRDWRDALR